MSRKHRRSGINWSSRKNCWIIDKQWKGQRLYRITFTDCADEAETFLDQEISKLRRAIQHGERPVYLFYEGAEKYLKNNKDAATFDIMQAAIMRVMPFIGKTPLQEIDDDALEPYIEWRKKEGVKTRKKNSATGMFYEVRREIKNSSINRELEIIRAILRSAAKRWRCKLTKKKWIDSAPLLTMLPTKPRKGEKSESHSAKPYSLSWADQDKLFPLLSARLQKMCLFKVNTGTREQEVCRLRWSWEHDVPELGITVFVVPEGYIKNGEARLIVMNQIARSVIETQREKWYGVSDYVFPNPSREEDQPYARIQTSSWKSAWITAGLPNNPWVCKGVHNLKHTCGRRLRAAEVSRETRKVCLGHKDGDITTHYSAAEIKELLNAYELLCERREGIVFRLSLAAHSN